MILKCAIIDDEPLAVELLSSYVNKTPFLKLTGAYNSASTAIRDLRENPVDLIFLDIQMPELSGIEFAKILPQETRIIFVTAFSQYAVEGYKVNAMDYLMKPVSYDTFLSAAKKAFDWFATKTRQEAYKQDRFIFVKSDYKLIRVNLDDIMYIEDLKDYVRIYLKDGNKLMSLMNMKNLEDNLPKPEFMRTHRSYIVHMNMVQAVDRFRLVFGDAYIPISDSYKDEVQSYLDRHTMM